MDTKYRAAPGSDKEMPPGPHGIKGAVRPHLQDLEFAVFSR